MISYVGFRVSLTTANVFVVGLVGTLSEVVGCMPNGGRLKLYRIKHGTLHG